jgi:transposase-like protein
MQNTEALGMLSSDTNTLFLDGTFYICPINFTQVLNIAADINGRVTLLFSIPMTSRKDELYIKVLEAVMSHDNMKGLTVKYAHADFESAISTAVNVVLPRARVAGCCFHYSQALIRKLRKPSNFTLKRYILQLLHPFCKRQSYVNYSYPSHARFKC